MFEPRQHQQSQHDLLYFNVVGPGYVSKNHTDAKESNLAKLERNAIGVATTWLAFYAIAVVAILIANFQKVASFVIASHS